MTEYTEITEGSKAIMRETRVMGTPIDLVPALRQYRHNNDDSLFFGLDYDETVAVFEKMQAELEQLRAKAEAFDFIEGKCFRYSANERAGGSFAFRVDDGSEYYGKRNVTKNLLEAVNKAMGGE